MLARKEDKAAEDNSKEISEEEVIRWKKGTCDAQETRKISNHYVIYIDSDLGADWFFLYMFNSLFT